jgi:hypothetical protein
MKTAKKLISEITQLVLHIKNEYPTLYMYLDENPETIPNLQHPKVNTEELEKYIVILKDLIDKKNKNKI